jgi:hypothetical protein
VIIVHSCLRDLLKEREKDINSKGTSPRGEKGRYICSASSLRGPASPLIKNPVN